MVVCSGSNTDYKSSEPLKTLVMLCKGNAGVGKTEWLDCE